MEGRPPPTPPADTSPFVSERTGRPLPPPPARPLPPGTIDHEADPGLALVIILMVALVAATLGVF